MLPRWKERIGTHLVWLWLACLAASTAGAASCRRRASRPPPTPPAVAVQPRTGVVLTTRAVRYYEDGKMLELPLDVTRDRTYRVFVPGPERWRQTMPAWAADRRDPIVRDITRLMPRVRVDWRDWP